VEVITWSPVPAIPNTPRCTLCATTGEDDFSRSASEQLATTPSPSPPLNGHAGRNGGSTTRSRNARDSTDASLPGPLGGLFDATTADEALTAGQPPTHAGWLSGGIDAAKVEQALAKLGAKKDGATLRLGGDNELNLDSPLSKALQGRWRC